MRDAIRGRQRPSEAVRGLQRSSELISGHHRMLLVYLDRDGLASQIFDEQADRRARMHGPRRGAVGCGEVYRLRARHALAIAHSLPHASAVLAIAHSLPHAAAVIGHNRTLALACSSIGSCESCSVKGSAVSFWSCAACAEGGAYAGWQSYRRRLVTAESLFTPSYRRRLVTAESLFTPEYLFTPMVLPGLTHRCGDGRTCGSRGDLH